MRLYEIASEIEEAGLHYDKLESNQFLPDPYYGRNIVWMGEKGRMVKLTPNNSEPIWGNIFHDDKIQETADAILDSEDTVQFNAPLVDTIIVGINDIRENIEYRSDAMYDPVIGGIHEFTTGDDDLDQYIVDPDEYLMDNTYDEEDIPELKQEMEDTLQQAIDEQWGDIGDPFYTVRDGNHRRAAAFKSGEPYIWGIVTDNDFRSMSPQEKKLLH